MNVTTHFTEEELKCPKTGVCQFNDKFLERLEDLRIEYGLPMIINSACRSLSYQKEKGWWEKAPNSYHIYDIKAGGRNGALAVDVRMDNITQDQREYFMCVASMMGWSIGIYKNFLHIDRRIDLGHAQVIFNGGY